MAKIKVFKTDGPLMADQESGALLVELNGVTANTLLAAASPGGMMPLASKTAGAEWDAPEGEPFELPAGTVFLAVEVDQDCYLVADNAEDPPAEKGVVWPAGTVWKLPCRGASKLHYMRATLTNAVVSVTAFVSGL